MPDWTYQTLFKPTLAEFGFDRGRALALGAMGRLAALPGGRWVIQLMGHMHPDERLAVERAEATFATRVGLGGGLDSQLVATRAFAEFGFGYLEVGPIVANPTVGESSTSVVDFQAETIELGSSAKLLTASEAAAKLQRHGSLPLPIFARLETDSPAVAKQMIDALDSHVEGYVLPAAIVPTVVQTVQNSDEHSTVGGVSDAEIAPPASETPPTIDEKILIVAVDSRDWHNIDLRTGLTNLLDSGELTGVCVAAATDRLGKVDFDESVILVDEIRRVIGTNPLVIGAVGVHSPADALDYLDAGADLVQVDAGLAFTGPSLPKRINEAMLYRQIADEPFDSPKRPWPQQSWFWAFLMGLGMLVGGVLAMGIAMTRIVMPYDESLVGMLRGELMQINERLLPFMQHDRVTLAGTMLAIGVLYTSLALFGIRRGAHWAYIAVVISATTGFFSFFTFLGFGYFDPFHAFVSAVLLQFLLLTTILPQPKHRHIDLPELHNDTRWRRHQWGQLAFVVHGVVLIFAGVVISVIGMTSVFVPEDLEFLQCSQRVLAEANPMLVPLVAHDRATFGGMLIATGLVTLLSALWGFRHGQAWLWWALMVAGNLAYWSTLGVHWAVGYNSLLHLVPAYGGLALLWLGGWASYAFMAQNDQSLIDEWRRRIKA